MIKNKKIKKYFYLTLFLCCFTVFQAGALDKASVEFQMTVPNPTCSVSISPQSVINLGNLTRTASGAAGQTHNDKEFSIIADCDGIGINKFNALTADIVDITQGMLKDNDRIAVKIGGKVDTTNGPFLQLKEKEGNQKFVTFGTGTSFCSTSEHQMNCKLIPVTSVFKGAPTGDGKVVLRFNMAYQ